jgi:hypothetical protein
VCFVQRLCFSSTTLVAALLLLCLERSISLDSLGSSFAINVCVRFLSTFDFVFSSLPQMLRRTSCLNGIFSRTAVFRGIGAYSLYMKQVSHRSELFGLPIAQRGKLIAAWYKSLTPKELEELRARAKATPSFKRRPVDPSKPRSPRKPRQPTAYNKFVGKSMKLPEVRKLSTVPERMRRVAQLWNQQKKK